MDPMLESKIDSLQAQVDALEANQKALINQGAYGEPLLETETGGVANYEIQYRYNNTDYSVPVQSSLILPKGLKAETISGSTIITEIEKPNYIIDETSFNNINGLFFDFLLGAGAMITMGLFMYYVRHFLFYFILLKK